MDRSSPWIVRFSSLVPERAAVLDLACGSGRHARFFVERGARVTCVDRDISGVADLAGRAELIAADLENGGPEAWPLAGRRFDAVVVTRYLFRPLFPRLLESVAPEGLLLYETFAVGQERFGRPSNPDFLLRPGELLELVRGRMTVVAYEDGIEQRAGGPNVVQRICARLGAEPSLLN